MKILQINCVYKKGSTGKIVYDIHTELQKHNFESIVCYGRGEVIKETNVYKTCGELYSKINNALSRLTGIMYGGCFFSTQKLIYIIKKEKPDIVHLHCINGYFVNIYKLVAYLKSNKIKAVLTLHGEFIHTANCGYAVECGKWRTGCGQCPRLRQETKSYFFDNTALSWRMMKKAFEGFDENLKIISVSPWLMKRAKQSPILANKDHSAILNGVDTETFYYRQSNLKQELALENRKIILHVTASFESKFKGGAFVIELARQMQDAIFIVIGSAQPDSSYPSNLIIVGRVEDQIRLAKYYSMAHVTLLTSKKETFSMPCAESLCCGTPVVGFKAGAPEEISLPEYSRFVEQGDCIALKQVLEKYLANSFDKKTISKHAISKYSKEIMATHYMEIYKNIV